MYDYLIVGAGLYGSTFANLANAAGKKCLVIDRRNETGGNVRCEDISGINVHKYGAHIFHTSNEQVWKYVCSHVKMNRYTNSPIANYEGKLYNLPFNMNTFYQMWQVTTPDEAMKIIDTQRQEAWNGIARQQKLKAEDRTTYQARNLEEQSLLLVGNDIYQKLIRGYTEKQWGRKCNELPAFIIRRLPLRFVFDNNYFSDTYQGIPIGGYNPLINSLLKNIEVRTGEDFFARREYWKSMARTIVFTGEIDRYFDYCYGHLQWRTVRFETVTLQTANYQGNAVVNYTERNVPYTRIIEHKHFESFGQSVYDNPTTVISREYSEEWHEGMEPFYPINDIHNTTLLHSYRELADKEENVIFGGRLAEYRYYDMAPTIENSMKAFEKDCSM